MILVTIVFSFLLSNICRFYFIQYIVSYEMETHIHHIEKQRGQNHNNKLNENKLEEHSKEQNKKRNNQLKQ